MLFRSPILRDSALVAVFGRERRPYSRFISFAGTRRAYTRYLIAQGRLVREPEAPNEDIVRRYNNYLIDVRGLSVSARYHHELTVRALFASIGNLKRRALAQVFPDAVTPPPGGRLLLDGTDLVGWLRKL